MELVATAALQRLWARSSVCSVVRRCACCLLLRWWFHRKAGGSSVREDEDELQGLRRGFVFFGGSSCKSGAAALCSCFLCVFVCLYLYSFVAFRLNTSILLQKKYWGPHLAPLDVLFDHILQCFKRRRLAEEEEPVVSLRKRWRTARRVLRPVWKPQWTSSSSRQRYARRPSSPSASSEEEEEEEDRRRI